MRTTIFKDLGTNLSGTVGIVEITEKQVCSRISPDVQNSHSQ